MDKIYKDKKTGLYYRPSRGELFVIKEQNQYDSLKVDNLVVMDVGANIGSFTSRVLQRGAKEVYCYEPHPETFKLLELNVNPNIPTYLYNVALMPKKGIITLFTGRYPAANSVIPSRTKTNTVEVEPLS